MELLRYSYTIESRFSSPVGYHAFKLRCIPAEEAFQHTVKRDIQVTPQCRLLYSTDGFGNNVVYGSICDAHDVFRLECSGVVERRPYAIPDSCPNDIYLFPSPLACWDKDIQQWAARRSAEDIMHAVHRHMKYERFATDNRTTALHVFNHRKGVCQDYAHLMIAACRAAGMRARYANGITIGEGETHAWVEVHDGVKWDGYDPTLDRKTDFSYLKFAHGRDVGDCPTNRGRMYGWTTETMNVHCEMHVMEDKTTRQHAPQATKQQDNQTTCSPSN